MDFIKKINIGSKDDCLGAELSNFNEYHFMFNGVFCHSMEGLLQSLKFENKKEQLEVCLMVGKDAKRKGRKKNWKIEQALYWNNKKIDRHSKEYQDLIDAAFSSLFKNENFKKSLLKTKGFMLTHDIGRNDPRETVLTIDEFCDRLMCLRDYY